MVDVIAVSPQNEMPVALKLQDLVRAAWPDVAISPKEHVTILVGVEMFREIDFVVIVRLQTPRRLPVMVRRDGTSSAADYIQGAVLAIEVKQLAPESFSIRGTEIFPHYGAGRTERSVNAQVSGAVTALRTWWGRYGSEQFFFYGIGWLTEVDEGELAEIGPWIVGNETTWYALLDAAAQRNDEIYRPRSEAYLAALTTLRDILTRTRVVSPLERERAARLCSDELSERNVSILAEAAGKQMIRLTGRGGSGKTTTLALLANRLATIGGERVLILTFHRTLRSDIAHLLRCTTSVPGVAGRRIVVETATTFFMSILSGFDCPLPAGAGGQPRYDLLDAALDDLRQLLTGDSNTGDAAQLKGRRPDRFDFDYVFVDEAQDWTDAERDFLRALYGSSRLVLADGLEQLVRRQSACDWIAGVPATERFTMYLGRSLRMTRHLAEFANAVAREAGFADWQIAPFDKLPGGRVLIAVGGDVDIVALYRAVRSAAAAGKALPVDTLTCVPARSSVDASAHVARILQDAGECVWDGTVAGNRDEAPTDGQCWRFVKYDSCRGLEGWVTIALGLDQLIASKIKYPNLESGSTETPESVARRWLMIALTRAVSTLIITITDESAPIVATLRAAAATLPDGIVRWTTAERLPGIVAPHAAMPSG